MEDHYKTLLLLNSVPHRLDAVLRSIHGAPTIEIDLATVNVSEGPKVNPEHVVVLRDAVLAKAPDYSALHKGQVVVFKQHGGFTVLLGKDKVAEYRAQGLTKIKGKLLSTPVLKKCRVPEEPAPQIRPEPFYRDPDGFTNRPRFQRPGEAVPLEQYRPDPDAYDRHQRQLQRMAFPDRRR
ncbi:hypothetical protein D3C71_78450 [compost metagenome]